MRYYLAGPMSGLPNFNYPQFELAASLLRMWGYEVLSPHEGHTSEPGSESYEYYIRFGINKLLQCDGIIMLPVWYKSKGSVLEQEIAKHLGMKIMCMYPEINTTYDWGNDYDSALIHSVSSESRAMGNWSARYRKEGR